MCGIGREWWRNSWQEMSLKAADPTRRRHRDSCTYWSTGPPYSIYSQ